MKAKIYTDGINFIGGFKKSSDMKKFWVSEIVTLTKEEEKHIKEFGHTRVNNIFVCYNVTASCVYA